MSFKMIDPAIATTAEIIESQILEGLAACKSTTEIAQIIVQTLMCKADHETVRLKTPVA